MHLVNWNVLSRESFASYKVLCIRSHIPESLFSTINTLKPRLHSFMNSVVRTLETLKVISILLFSCIYSMYKISVSITTISFNFIGGTYDIVMCLILHIWAKVLLLIPNKARQNNFVRSRCLSYWNQPKNEKGIKLTFSPVRLLITGTPTSQPRLGPFIAENKLCEIFDCM